MAYLGPTDNRQTFWSNKEITDIVRLDIIVIWIFQTNSYMI